MMFHIENNQVVFKVFNHGNFTVKTTSGEIVKLSSKEFWTHFFWQYGNGNNESFILALYDAECRELERFQITPQNMLGSNIIV